MKIYKHFIIEEKNKMLKVTISRPEVRNAINEEVVNELSDILDEIETDKTFHVVVFTGAGDKSFISGSDLTYLKERTMLDALSGKTQHVFSKLESCKKPTIALVNGYALGGGFEFALSCDIRLATHNARFGFPEPSIGIIPGAGGTQKLARCVGLSQAKDIMITGKIVDCDEALKIGIVSRIVGAAEVESLLTEITDQIGRRSSLAVRIAKNLVSTSLSVDQQSGLYMELLGYALTMGSEDKNEGVDAFFQKRPPEFKGY